MIALPKCFQDFFYYCKWHFKICPIFVLEMYIVNFKKTNILLYNATIKIKLKLIKMSLQKISVSKVNIYFCIDCQGCLCI